MPRLNTVGAAVMMGPGAGPMRCWLTDGDTLEQDCVGGCDLISVHLENGEVTIQSPHGANWLQAGDGVWAARLQGTGYFDSLGRADANFIPLAVDTTSGAVLVGNYTTGAGLWIWWPEGRFDTVSLGIPDVQQGDYRGGVAVYRMGGLTVRYPQGDTRLGMANPRYGYGYLTGNAPLGLGWWPWANMAQGLLLSNDGQDFNPDICLLPSGLVRVVSSRTAGEAPGDLRIYDIDPIALTVNGRPGVPYTAPVVPPIIPPVEPPVIPPVTPPIEPPVIPPVKPPVVVPIPLEFFMSVSCLAVTLFASRFKPHPSDAGKWVYPMGEDEHGVEKHYAIDLGTGEPKYGGLPNTGPGETFTWVKGSGRAYVDTGWMGYTALVDETR